MLKGAYLVRIVVSTDKCIASGSCVLICPQVFAQRESDGVVDVLNAHPELQILKTLRAVVDGCPAEVFSIEDEQNTTEIILVEESKGLD